MIARVKFYITVLFIKNIFFSRFCFLMVGCLLGIFVDWTILAVCLFGVGLLYVSYEFGDWLLAKIIFAKYLHKRPYKRKN